MPDGLACEYGSSHVQECDETVTCMNGSWYNPPPPPGPPPPLACIPSQPITCPGTFASVPRGSACTPDGGYCDYPEGRCSCNVPTGGPPPVNPKPTWNCQDPQQGCPLPRPRLGSTCATEGATCDYGTCTIEGGSQEACMGGVWVAILGACAVAAGR